MNFDKKRFDPNEIPSEVEVSIVKMIVITQEDCIKVFKKKGTLAMHNHNASVRFYMPKLYI